MVDRQDRDLRAGRVMEIRDFEKLLNFHIDEWGGVKDETDKDIAESVERQLRAKSMAPVAEDTSSDEEAEASSPSAETSGLRGEEAKPPPSKRAKGETSADAAKGKNQGR